MPSSRPSAHYWQSITDNSSLITSGLLTWGVYECEFPGSAVRGA
jgi:hypothetical protein